MDNVRRGNDLEDTSASRVVTEDDSESLSGIDELLHMIFALLGENMPPINNDDDRHENMASAFLGCLGFLAEDTEFTVRRNAHRGELGKARLRTFEIHSEATAAKRGGNNNRTGAWFASSKNEIVVAMRYGFGRCETPAKGGSYGCGIHLFPLKCFLDSVESSVPDETGTRHVILCRLLLGNAEEVALGSKQFHPSSDEFDSGVDNLADPKRYIVWSTRTNTHIVPELVISYNAHSLPTAPRTGRLMVLQPASSDPSVKLPAPLLIDLLEEFLHPRKVLVIRKSYDDYQAERITLECMMAKWKKIAGEQLIISVMEIFVKTVRYTKKAEEGADSSATNMTHLRSLPFPHS